MKFTIDYYDNNDHSQERPCGALSQVFGRTICASGATWEEARDSLLEKLKRMSQTRLPAREIVDVNVSGDIK